MHYMFDFIYVGAPLVWNSEIIKILNFSSLVLFSKVCLATRQIKSILVIIRLPSQMSPTIQPNSRIPEKLAG